jgi:hypothetical protein
MASPTRRRALAVSPRYQSTLAWRGHRLPGAQVVAPGLEAGDGLAQQLLGLDGPARLLGGLGGLLQDRGSLGMVAAEQRQGPPIVDVGPGDVQGHGPVAGQDQEAAGGAVQGGGLLGGPRRPGQLQGRQVVVGEQLGMVGDPVAGHPLDPGGHRPVLGDPGRPRQPAVGHLPGEGVPEGVLALAGDRGPAGRADERPAGQLPEGGLGGGRVPPANGEQRPRPEHRAHDRGVLQQGPALGGRVSSRAAIRVWMESGRTVSAAVSRTVAPSRSSRPRSSSMRQTCSA